MDIFQYLKQTSIFADLSNGDLLSISKKARLVSAIRGEFLFCEGDFAEAFYIAISGFYRLIQHGDNGQEIIAAVFGSGDPIGLVAVLRGGKYPSSVEVMDDGQLLWFAVDKMDEILEQYPTVTKHMLIAVHQRLCESHQRIRELCTEPVEQRLAGSLIRLIHKVGVSDKNGAIDLNLRLRRRDLAQLNGTTIETVSRTLKTWERNSVVETGRERVGVVDVKQLQSIAEGKLVLS